MIRSIVNLDDSRPLNINQTLASLATAIICRMDFGRKYSDPDLRGFSSMVRECFQLLGSFNIVDYIPYLDWMDLQGLIRRMKKLHKTEDHLLDKVIDEHVSRNDSNITHDFLDILLAASADKDGIKGVLFVS
jgi:ferulate-5-hydroxylase